MATSSLPIHEAMLIPDLLGSTPQARAVLDKYGLRGCGGETGPHETLGFFARAHDVPIQRLLVELREAVDRPLASASTAARERPTLADSIYRPFFLAGIATVLTLGAAWGAWLLLQIALGGRFNAVGLHEINAHGHAQIFGWVGLFVMGFAYQAFPRFKHTELLHPRLAMATFVILLLGLVVRSVVHPLAATSEILWWTALAAAVMEVAAIGLFAWLIVVTLRRSGRGWAFYDGYILSAIGWFVLQAVYEAVYLTATLSAPAETLVELVATWQAPLRDMQIHGFALLMILGVSQRAFHHFYGLPEPNARLSKALLPVLNAAVAGEILGLVLMRTAGPGWAALWYLSVLVLLAACAALVLNWRIYSPAADSDRSLKFLRIAYVWLFVSLVMLAALPAWQAAIGWLAPAAEAASTGFSHAYYGATRHAITVGFISLMIVGVSAKVVPTLCGVDGRRLTSLWAPLALIQLGCTLRVVGQMATDFTPLAFPFAGVSGLLEVSGLALWGGHLGLVMFGKARQRKAAGPVELLAGREIRPTDSVAAVLEDEPQLLELFLEKGFKQLASPYARKSIARVVTLRQACQRTGVDEATLLAELNERRRRLRSLRLPVLDSRPCAPEHASAT